jgi:hypothetical protein
MSRSTLQCNLCWKELREPFIVTSCSHAFCMDHQHDTKIKESTCPGCNKHISPSSGVKIAHYSLEKLGDASILNGMRPEDAIKLCATSLKLCVVGARTGRPRWLCGPSISAPD